ncbi:flagellar type III secretion system protein FliR [Metabacillus sp. GX 13764]|uniref:flagellar biosynthetic protein FliR n=1 Tax=Metabacillus kandeliae TaxID=2900151 RepID=UPI001E4D90E1|nr:flagellar biosynthetic protein FliR [Metabacillus kandeliae]MCD7033766.1 flagellar type III secretion system protein FliR [Metabacillus kandeliae]
MNILSHYPFFLLIFTRLSSFFLILPIYSYRNIPAFHKVGFAFVLSWVIYFTLPPAELEINGLFFGLLFKELCTGLLIGFMAYMVLAAIQAAGGFIDFQLGFGIANIIDPMTGAQSPLTGQFLYTFALLFMLSVNAHHMLLDGVYYSFQYIPPEQAALRIGDGSVMLFILKTFSSMFLIAFQMAIPVAGSLFIVDVALGIVARTVPQMNVFVIGMPLKIGVGFIILIVVMGAMFMLIQGIFETMTQTMKTLMEMLGGGGRAAS